MSEALGEIRALLGIGDADCERLLKAAADCYAEGDLEKCEAILTGLLALSHDVRPLKLLASVLFLQRRHDEATIAYQQAYEMDDTDLYTLVALGELKLKSMRFDDALPVFRRLFELDPKGEHPAANRGRHLVREYCSKLQQAGHRA